jgi:MFS superfamily sulfate permease-like transporter
LSSAIGDASLAGLPPEAGLYSIPFGSLVFWAFCSSNQTAVAVTSAISLLVGATLGRSWAFDSGDRHDRIPKQRRSNWPTARAGAR